MAQSTLTRSNSVQEEEDNLKDLGTIYWNEFSSLKPQPVGIKLIKLSEDMWSKSGLIVTREEEKQGRRYNVIFNKEYVLDYLHNNVFKALGIRKNGVFNQELLDEIIKAAIEYSNDEDKREKEKELLRVAQSYIEERGLTQEQALELVRKQEELAEKYLAELASKSK